MDMNAQFGQLYAGMVAAHGGNAALVDGQLSSFGINLAAGMATAYDVEVDFGVPQTLTFGLGYRSSPRLGLGLDIGWVGYKNAFDQFPIRLTSGTSGNINILVNGSPTNGSFTTAWPLAWKDSWTVRVGGEYAATPALMLRGGVIYNTNPVANEGLFTIFPAIVTNSVTLGAGYQVGRTMFNLTYAHTLDNDEQAGTPHLVATEYAGSTSRLGERTFSAGASWRF
jgi:long-subunit fatty acid transport protein